MVNARRGWIIVVPHEGRDPVATHKQIDIGPPVGKTRVRAMLGRLHHIAGILAFSMCVASVARAEDDNPIELSWSVPPEGECPDATYILGEIRRYVGPGRADRKPIRANVVIRRAGAGVWQMVMKTEQGPSHGERTFRDASCDAISDAAVAVLAWMIDPDAMAEHARPAAADRSTGSAHRIGSEGTS